MRFSRFVILIYSVRELPRFLPKLANFSKICDIRYQGGKYLKSFPWIYDLAAVNGVTVDRGIVMGRDC